MSVIDFSDIIIAKSDQLNASDIAGSLTIKIVDAKKAATSDQPLSIFYEGGGNKPWKPCKTMRRVMGNIWGSPIDLKGRSVTLICDPKVTWGGAEVGGIRITHMSHIDKQIDLPVRVSKHKVEKYTVLPLKTNMAPAPAPAPATAPDPLPPPDELINAGAHHAQKGVAAYKNWLASLDESAKAMIKHKHSEWSAIAKKADEDDGFPL